MTLCSYYSLILKEEGGEGACKCTTESKQKEGEVFSQGITFCSHHKKQIPLDSSPLCQLMYTLMSLFRIYWGFLHFNTVSVQFFKCMYLTVVTILNCIAITKSTRGSIFPFRYAKFLKRIMVFWLSITGLLIFYRNTSCSSPCGRVFIRWWWCPSHSRGTHYGHAVTV